MNREAVRWFALIGCCAAVGCKGSTSGGGGGSSSTSSSLSYVATSGEGDLAVWVVADGGADIRVTLTKVDETGNAVDGGTHVITGACSARNATFDYRTCTLSGVTPTIADGGSPKAGDQFYTLEFPGVAYIAHPAGSGGERRHDLHLGVIMSDCHNLSGTYNTVRVGPPGVLSQVFGQSTLTGASDGTISGVTNYDYGLVVNGAYSTGNSNDPIKSALTSGDQGTMTIPDGGSTCANGVTTIDIPTGQTSSMRARATATAAGAVLIDLARGSGGIIGISAANAATINDLRNRTLYLMTYGGGDPLTLMNVRIGDAGEVTLVAQTRDAGIENDGGVGRLVALSDSTVATWFGAGNWVDGRSSWGGMVDGGSVTTWNPPDGGRASSPAPASMSGFFTIVDSMGNPFGNEGRSIIMMAQKADGGVFFSGAHMAANNQNTGMDGDGGYTRCFARDTPSGMTNPRRNDRQTYCVDGQFVGFGR
ncbi:MAG: hypothetical protein HYY84_10420 [Deltaproteobacteria bacterium]|nr:hypothetical protein [Deltaproteobacteria bacterium]